MNKIAQRLKEIQERGILRREATVGAIDVEARTVELSFSSETEKVERWFGIEILGHEPGECNLSRLNNKAPVLWMHNWDDQRGVVEPGTARIDVDRIGRLKARYSKSAEGDKLFQDIVDGIVTKVSVGYSVEGMRLVEERNGIDVYRITAWTPYEVSNVSVAADDDIGVGRSAEKPQEERPAKSAEDSSSISTSPEQRTFKRTDNTMNEKILRDAQGNLVRAKVDQDGKIVEVLEMLEKAGEAQAQASARGAETERARVNALTEMGEQYKRTDLALKFIKEGKSPEDMRRVLLDDLSRERGARPLDEQQRVADVGLTEKEVAKFSLVRAIAYLADPNDKTAREAAAFEIEASRAAAQRYGKNAKGIVIPNEVLASRTFSVSTQAGTGNGAALVDNTTLFGSMIEMLRKKSWLMRRARTLAGLVGNVDIPRQNGGTNTYWVGEHQGPNKSGLSFDQIAFTPKTLGAKVEMTRRLLMQSTPDVENMVRNDIIKSMRLEIDRVGIYGTGTQYQPRGLKNFDGINAVAFATAGKPTNAELVEMETLIALDDADVDSMSYAFNAGIRGHLKTTEKFAGTGITLWEAGNTVNGYAADVSNQIATGEVLFGNWDDLVIAMWGGMEITVDPYAMSDSGGLKIVALQDIDTNIRHSESFCFGA